MPLFITFDRLLSTYVINPTNPATDLGIFTIKGELREIDVSDSYLSTEFSFKVEVFNTPPKMKDQIPDFKLYLGTPLTYKLPNIEDEEELPIKIQL
jgi:hypothetical protein